MGSDDFTKQPQSQYLGENILKPIRVFLLSLTEAQSRGVPLSIFTESNETTKKLLHRMKWLNTQQITLLHEARGRIRKNKEIHEDLNGILEKVVTEYEDTFCNDLEDALSTHNVLSALNYIQNKESVLKELRVIAVETHENLQMRDILFLSKQHVHILRMQIEKIKSSIAELQDKEGMIGIDEGSDWMKDKFTINTTAKGISKIRNALIRFLNDYGIGKVDFKYKFGGSVLDFTNKRISRVLVNAVIFEVHDMFWSRCPIEDPKFKHQIQALNDKFPTLKDFMLAFLNARSDAVESKKVSLPKLSEESLSMMIERVESMSSDSATVTISDFQDSIATVRETLVASINGADSASGDDYLPLFCYVIMKGLPDYLPSQLQTAKVISQRKEQDKYFIDCCVAMKALRNFCNVLFKTEHEEEVTTSTTTNGQTSTIGRAAPPPPIPDGGGHEEEAKAKSNGTTKSLFNTLRSKLPQRTPKGNGNLFNNLSPSNFIQRKSPSQSPTHSQSVNKESPKNTTPSGSGNDNDDDDDDDKDNDKDKDKDNEANDTEKEDQQVKSIENDDDDGDVMVKVSAKLN